MNKNTLLNQIYICPIGADVRQHTITKNDLNSFIAESNRPEIDQRLLIGATERISPNGDRLLNAQDPIVKRWLRSNFEGSKIEWPTPLKALSGGHRKAQPTPDPHQEEAVNDVVAGFRDADLWRQ